MISKSVFGRSIRATPPLVFRIPSEAKNPRKDSDSEHARRNFGEIRRIEIKIKMRKQTALSLV